MAFRATPSFTEWLQRLLDPTGSGLRSIILFLLGSVMLGVAGAAAYDLLIEWLGSSTGIKGLILAGSLLVLLGAALGLVWIARLVARRWPRPALGAVSGMPTRRALIAFVSLPPGTAHEDAVAYHLTAREESQATIEHAILFCSRASGARAWNYIQVVQSSQGGRPRDMEPRLLENIYDLHQSYRAINRAIDDLLDRPAVPRLTRQDIVLEATGGTAMFTAAATLVALERGVELQYIEPGLFADGRPNFGRTTPKRVDVAWIEIPPEDRGRRPPARADEPVIPPQPPTPPIVDRGDGAGRLLP